MVESGKCQRFNYYDEKENVVHYNKVQTETCTFPVIHPIVLPKVVRMCILRGNLFHCRVFAMKSVQDLKSFWRSSQN
jgi:hypothetical protein